MILGGFAIFCVLVLLIMFFIVKKSNTKKNQYYIDEKYYLDVVSKSCEISSRDFYTENNRNLSSVFQGVNALFSDNLTHRVLNQCVHISANVVIDDRKLKVISQPIEVDEKSMKLHLLNVDKLKVYYDPKDLTLSSKSLHGFFVIE